MKLDTTTVIVVGVAAYLILRNPAHAAPPYYPQPQQQPQQPRQPGDPPPADAHWISQLGYSIGTIGSMITQAVGNLKSDKAPAGADKQASNASPEASAKANSTASPEIILA